MSVVQTCTVALNTVLWDSSFLSILSMEKQRAKLILSIVHIVSLLHVHGLCSDKLDKSLISITFLWHKHIHCVIHIHAILTCINMCRSALRSTGLGFVHKANRAKIVQQA